MNLRCKQNVLGCLDKGRDGKGRGNFVLTADCFRFIGGIVLGEWIIFGKGRNWGIVY